MGGEVVVEEHEVGRFAGDVGSGAAHGDADVRGPEGGSVVHPIAGHGDDVTSCLQRAGDAELVLRCHAGQDEAVSIEQRTKHLLVVR
jgi:hypothetical protein